jgi:hypothetical protein
MGDDVEFKSFHDAEGKRRVSVMARKDGLFRFVEEGFFEEMGYTYWTPTHYSGLYETAEMAEREARAILPWLRGIPN